MNIDLKRLEEIEVDAGSIYIIKSDTNHSSGFLRLLPGRELDRHNRPVEEWLVQIEGESLAAI